MPSRIDTEISIKAPPERVWAVLTDFAAYPQWNPFIKRLSGRAEVGETLEATFVPPGRTAQTIRPVVIAAKPYESFEWRGSLPVPGLFEAVHSFQLSPAGSDTRLRHSESFSGLLVPFLGGVIVSAEQGFIAMNEALRSRCEG